MRTFRRLRTAAPILAAAGLLAGGLVHQAPHAGAFAEWCFDDPLVLVDGVPQSITIAIPTASLSHIHGPVSLSVQVPSNHPASLGESPAGAFAVTTTLTQSSADEHPDFAIAARVHVQADTDVPLQLIVVNGAGIRTVATETAGDSVDVKFSAKLATSH